MQMNDFSPGTVWGIRAGAMETMLKSMPSPDAMASISVRFKEEPEEDFDFMLRDGVAIIPVTGTIFKRGSIWSYLYGGTPLTVLNQVLAAALDDRDVEAIVLDMDSPGGQLSGTDGFSDLVYAARKEKPVVAFANGMMCSAAYWIGSAADRVVIERTAQVGSIGIIYMHHDWSKADAEMGLTITVLSAGKYKAVGNNAEPLTDEARGIIQAELDDVYDLFIQTVARNRDVSEETVRTDMADGRVFIGQKAVDVGLADSLGVLDDAIEMALSLVPEGTSKYFNFSKGANVMKISTVDELKAHAPELCKQLIDTAVAGVDHKEAVQAETARLLGLVNVHFGAEAGEKFKAVVETGVTEEQYKAIRGDQPAAGTEAGGEAEEIDAAKQAMLAAIQQSGAQNPGAGGEGSPSNKDFLTLVEETMQVKNCSKRDAMKIVMKANSKAHEDYLKSVNQ
jgi:signal peptide peptidase SppA